MPSIIEASDISKSYAHVGSVVHALQNISLTIEKGDIFGIIGMSGAGKSTLIRCLARLIQPTSGSIFFQGQEVASIQGKALREFHRIIGMIFQHFNLFNSKNVGKNVAYALENSRLPPQQVKERVDTLLSLVGLSDKKETYPAQLSGGEKQRVGIARALANHPKVLFCDEATSSLDPKTTREILELLKSIHREFQITIVLITHEMEVIKKICNKVAVIESGRIIEQGSVAQVFANPQHPTTKHFVQTTSHEIPEEFFKEPSPNRKLLRLIFKGQAAGEPIISQLVRLFNVNVNILLGWIDHIQTSTLGTLVIEMTGEVENIQHAFSYLSTNQVQYEVLEHE